MGEVFKDFKSQQAIKKKKKLPIIYSALLKTGIEHFIYRIPYKT